MRLIYAGFLLMILCPFLLLAQQTDSVQQSSAAQQKEVSDDLWLARSKAITEDLIKDAGDLTPSARALLWARLAQRWWQIDPEQAHSWMLKPIEIVETVPSMENHSERSERLSTARLLLTIVAPLDQKLSQRLIVVLSGGAEHLEDAERSSSAEGLVEAALTLVEKDPQRAAQLGALALQMGHPVDIAFLIYRLRDKDAGLADALFAQTLQAARQTMDSHLINSLTQHFFTELLHPDVHFPPSPDNLRTQLLRLDIDYLQANPINEQNQSTICLSVVSFIAPVLSQFDRLLPEQAGIARQSVSLCQSTSPLIRQRVDDALRDQPLNTVDDLLKAADDAQDIKVRTVYLYRAAALAKQQNDIDRALKILDSMSAESRDFMGEAWKTYRWQWAALSAIQHFKNGDITGMHLVINAVPDDLQPFAKLAFVSQLPTTKNKETDPTLEFLNDVRVGLRRSTVSDAEKISEYFALLRLTVKYQPTEATAVLKEAVAALNRAEQAKDQKSDQNQPQNLDTTDISKSLPAALLEMDEYSVKEAIASISSPDTRTQVRLELLGACLQKLRSTKQASPTAKPMASKGE